jgi:hypothetical protein
VLPLQIQKSQAGGMERAMVLQASKDSKRDAFIVTNTMRALLKERKCVMQCKMTDIRHLFLSGLKDITETQQKEGQLQNQGHQN